MGVPYRALDLDQMDQEGKELRAELAKKTKRTSMPNMFIAGQGIGGGAPTSNSRCLFDVSHWFWMV